MFIRNDSRVLNDIFPLTINKTLMTRQEYPPDFHHWHNFFEISYMMKGDSICHVGDQYYHVTEGDIVLFNNTEVHGWDIQEDMRLLVLNFTGEIIYASGGDSLGGALDAFDSGYLGIYTEDTCHFQNIIYKYGKYTQNIYQLMQEIYDEYTHERSGKYLMIKANVLKILTILYRNFQLPPTRHYLLAEKRENLIGLERVLDYMNAHYEDKIILADMAEINHMNPTYFSTFFHKITGQKFSEYIINLRIQKAHERIISTRDSITTIAMECGFSNMSNFYRLYHNRLGHTPSESRGVIPAE